MSVPKTLTYDDIMMINYGKVSHWTPNDMSCAPGNGLCVNARYRSL